MSNEPCTWRCDVHENGIDVSLIVPVYNEEESIREVLQEAVGVLDAYAGSYEILAVDDGSTDRSPQILAECAQTWPGLRVLRVTPNSGQSAAFGVGFEVSRGRIVVLIDGDGQNDPNDIPAMVDLLDTCDACCGYRATRRDTWSKRIGSRLANAVRRSILHDGIIDTGCSLKAVKAAFVSDLPMTLRGMHRFLPVLWMMRGAQIRQMPVNHRPRLAGQSKYTNFSRLVETVSDVWAVRWMQKRYRRFGFSEQPCA